MNLKRLGGSNKPGTDAKLRVVYCTAPVNVLPCFLAAVNSTLRDSEQDKGLKLLKQRLVPVFPSKRAAKK